MILIDDSKILNDSYHIDGVYHVENRDGCKDIKDVFLDGTIIVNAISCDVNRGFLIRPKLDISGKIMTTDDGIIYEIMFGRIEVILNGT